MSTTLTSFTKCQTIHGARSPEPRQQMGSSASSFEALLLASAVRVLQWVRRGVQGINRPGISVYLVAPDEPARAARLQVRLLLRVVEGAHELRAGVIRRAAAAVERWSCVTNRLRLGVRATRPMWHCGTGMALVMEMLHPASKGSRRTAKWQFLGIFAGLGCIFSSGDASKSAQMHPFTAQNPGAIPTGTRIGQGGPRQGRSQLLGASGA